MPDEAIPIAATPLWGRLSDERRDEVRRHSAAWRFSQFLHGEQGALVCTAKIVQSVPHLDAKFYAATQVIDEARHVEVYSRYLHEKIGVVYPLNPNLKSLLDDVISDSRWDMTYLGMQVLIEGLALAAFGLIRNQATEPLGKALNAYVMQDEARHVMFGRLALRDYYPQLTEAERDEREEFCVDACYRMRDRFLAEDLWRNLDLPVDEVKEHLRQSPSQQLFTLVPVPAHRADPARHRLVGPADPPSVHRDGRDRVRRHRSRRRDGERRAGRRGVRRSPPHHVPHTCTQLATCPCPRTADVPPLHPLTGDNSAGCSWIVSLRPAHPAGCRTVQVAFAEPCSCTAPTRIRGP